MDPAEKYRILDLPSGSGTPDATNPENPPAMTDSSVATGSGSDISDAPMMSDALDSLAHLGSELERLSKSVVQREQELRKLITLMQTIARGVLLEDVLSKIFDSFTGVIPFERIGCAFLSDNGTQLTAYWAKSELGPMQISGGYTQPMAGSSLEQIIKTQQPRIINDLEAYLAAKPASESTRSIVGEGGRSSLTCPLIVEGGRPLGFLFFTSRLPNTYQKVHQYVFRQIAGQVATVIEKSREYQNLIDSNRVLIEKGQSLEVMATRDALTGAINRGAIDSVLARRAGEPAVATPTYGVIMVDIDHFKNINDTFGHPSGDLVLKELVIRLNSAIRRSDVLGRYGGEEFLIVLNDSTPEQLVAAMERLREATSSTLFDVVGQKYAVTASFGGVVATRGTPPSDLIRKADRALYEAKARGRNACVMAAESW